MLRGLYEAVEVLSEAVATIEPRASRESSKINPMVEELRKKLSDVFYTMLSYKAGNLTAKERDIDRNVLIPVLNDILRFCRSDEATTRDCKELLASVRQYLQSARTHAKRIQQHEYTKYGTGGHKRIMNVREIRDLMDRVRVAILKNIEKKVAVNKRVRQDRESGQQSLPGIQ